MKIEWKPINTAPKGDANVFFVRNAYGEIEIAWTNWNYTPGVRSRDYEESQPYSIMTIGGHGVRVGSLMNHVEWARIPLKDDESPVSPADQSKD